MRTIVRFLFPKTNENLTISWFLLGMRIFLGSLFLMHGIQKWINFEAVSQSFPDPLGVGSQLSLGLAIFGEVFCSLGFIFGAFYRLALIPMIFTMGMAFFVIHGNDPFAARELALVYGGVFLLMYITGPGRFSLDRMVANVLAKK